MNKKFYRCRQNKKLCGVCSGIGQYFGVDPVLIRLLTILILLFSNRWAGVVLVAYFVLALCAPLGDEQ